MVNFLKIIFLITTILCIYILVQTDSCAISAKEAIWQSNPNGISFASVPITKETDESIHFIKFDSSKYKAKILLSSNFSGSSLKAMEIVQKSGAVAAINASYFDVNGQPLGYLKVSGKVKNDYIASPIIYSGIISINKGQLNIIHRNSFIKGSTENALQVGPILIKSGKRVTGLENTIDYKKQALRSGLALDKSGNIIFFKTHGGIASWKQVIDTINSAKSLNIIDAINLDGGSSSQIYVSTKPFQFDESGMASVPVFIGIFKK